MANDSALAAQIGNEVDPAAVDRLIDDAFAAKASEMEAQIARNAEEAVRVQDALAQAQADAATRKSTVTDLERQLDDERSAAAAALAAASQAAAISDSEIQRLHTQVAQQQGRADTATKRLGEIKLASGIAAAVLVGVAGAVVIGAKLVSGAVGVTLTAVIAVVLAYLALRLVWKTAAAEFSNLVALVAGVIAIIGLAFAHASPSTSHHPAEHTSVHSKRNRTPG